MATNWKAIGRAAKRVRKSHKDSQQMVEFLQNYPEEGYMRDNISKNVVLIKDCKSSSLRRYITLLNSYYYLELTTLPMKEKILAKKVEIERELNSREDGIL